MNLGARTRVSLDRVRRGAREKALAVLARSMPGSEALDGKLRPTLLSAMTPIAASRGNPQFLFSTRDREIGWSTYRHSGFDEARTAWVAQRLSSCFRGQTVLDIGANIGTVAIPMVKSYGAARAVAFEPDPLNFKLLRCNVLLNDLEGIVDCVPVAISDADGCVELELSEHNYGDHRVRVAGVSRAASDDEPPRSTITATARRLIEALVQAGVDESAVGLVWGDTQGHEGHVMAGAGGLLGRVPWVLEYWPYGLRRSGGVELFHEHVTRAFSTVIDIKASISSGRDVCYAPSDIACVGESLGARSHTDLLLLP